MSRVITFSRTFPKYHPRAGEETHFVEQIWNGITQLGLPHLKNSDFSHEFMWSILPLSNYGCKFHTIRAGNRWKVGDKFSPRVWSGKPYHTKQIIIAPDIEVKKVWDFEMDINGIYSIDGKYTSEQNDADLATNDGLSEPDMHFWFMPNYNKPKEFKGQVICWDENIEY